MKIFGIFDADWIWTLPALTAWLWASGGSGAKTLRRAGVPIAIVLYAIGYGLSGWRVVLALVPPLAIIGFGPGYGDDFAKKLKGFYWPYIFILGGLYAACLWPLVWHFGHLFVFGGMVAATSLIFGGSMYLSKKFGLPWKVAEMMTGGIVGLTAALVIGPR